MWLLSVRVSPLPYRLCRQARRATCPMCQTAVPLHVRYASLWRVRQQQAQHRPAAAGGGDAAAAGQQQGAAEGIPGLQILVQQMQVSIRATCSAGDGAGCSRCGLRATRSNGSACILLHRRWCSRAPTAALWCALLHCRTIFAPALSCCWRPRGQGAWWRRSRWPRAPCLAAARSAAMCPTASCINRAVCASSLAVCADCWTTLAADVQVQAWPPPEAVLPPPLPQQEHWRQPQAPAQPAEPAAEVPEQPHNAAVPEAAGGGAHQQLQALQHQHGQEQERQQRAGSSAAAGAREAAQPVEARQQQAGPAAQGQQQAEQQQPVRRRGLFARLLRRRQRGPR